MNRIFIENGTVCISTENGPAGILRAYAARPGYAKMTHPQACELISVNGASIEWLSREHGIRVKLALTACDGGYSGRLSAAGAGRAIVRISWTLPEDEDGFPFVPAFMYGYNLGGGDPDAMYPMLDNGSNGGRTKPWVAGEWQMRTDRSSHGFTSVIAPRNAYALGGRDVCKFSDGTVAEKTGISTRGFGPHRLNFSLGFINSPYTYSYSPGRNYYGRPEGFVDLDRGEVSVEIFLLLLPSEGRLVSAKKLMRAACGLLHDTVAFDGTIREAVEAIGDALVKYGYCVEARNFYVEIHEGEDEIRRHAMFNSAWAGGMRTAYPLLIAGRRTGSGEWVRIAEDVISNIADNAISPATGMYFENYDLRAGEWNNRPWWAWALREPGHTGVVNGQLCYYMALAYSSELEHGEDHRNWLDSARAVLDRFIETQLADGSFGFLFSGEDGSVIDTGSFGPSGFAPALAMMYEITGSPEYLGAAIKTMDFYRTALERFELSGGTVDTPKDPDEEGVLMWIKAAAILHRLTGEQRYLDDLIDGIEYEFSWKFSFNVRSEIEPLKSAGWCSTGGSVTSVNNSHIHPMGQVILDEILYAFEKTGDPYFKMRLDDTLNWSLNAYLREDGQYGWGRKGLINERFCYTDSLLTERFPDGSPSSTWFCGHSWASGAMLEGLSGRVFDRK